MNHEPGIPEPLSVDNFADYYRAVHGYRPFRWQERIAALMCAGDPPDYIRLPTSSGKTALIDIAVFALAYQAAIPNRREGIRTAPRRIFFVVDRRIIVNEAYRRTRKAAEILRSVLDPEAELSFSADERDIVTRVARWLQQLAGDISSPPLDCFELRGGIYRDDAWVRSPLQPTVLTSTVDQVGSRLLFRGYGVSDRNLSIHAALTANDSLIVLDEAHCAKPFSQTMEAIRRYRGTDWAREAIAAPFHFVQMTATPPAAIATDKVFQLDSDDYIADPPLEQRHGCSKPVGLVSASGAKGKNLTATLAKKLVEQAEMLAREHQLCRIAIVVNRVAIAREAFARLEQKQPGRVSLMIGRMRPWDRDRLTDRIQSEFGSGWTGKLQAKAEEGHVEPRFVVATQCLEVGADLDFDGMVCQCASLDALRQRFGRMNRLGQCPNARGVIVAAEGDIVPPERLDDAQPVDAVYGNALARTWHWLHRHAAITGNRESEQLTEVIDFGVRALQTLLSANAENRDFDDLSAPAPNAPVLMPAHVDMLCQTSPRPTPEPDVAIYLHGPTRGQPEVRVCWRADLDLSDLGGDSAEQAWIAAVDLCPPSSAECLAVPLYVFHRWMRGANAIDHSGDVLGEVVEPDELKGGNDDLQRSALVWRGRPRRGDSSERTFLVNSRNTHRIHENDTIVIPAEFGGWNVFGYVPEAPADPAEEPELFPTFNQREMHEILMGGKVVPKPSMIQAASPNEACPALHGLQRIDIADRTFQQTRARTILRVHPKLKPEPELATLWNELLSASADLDADIGLKRWRSRADEICRELELPAMPPTDAPAAIRLMNLGKSTGGQIVRYKEGLAWITERHPSFKPGMLPLATFGDEDDSLSHNGRVSLPQHLADVQCETARIAHALDLDPRIGSTIVTAARLHDIGKADARFQAMLIGKPLSVAYMQPQLWAKSEGNVGGATPIFPAMFRHEMLSLSLLDHFENADAIVDTDLLKHGVASHHGYGRPFAPVCIDETPPCVNLNSLGGETISAEDRRAWTPAHRLDSGIAERFWALNRRYGWWGLAYIESLLRLADWSASAVPGRGRRQLDCAMKCNHAVPPREVTQRVPLALSGIDGSNPLGFLAAIGAFRILSESVTDLDLRMEWHRFDGAWRPLIRCGSGIELVADEIVSQLDEVLRVAPDSHPAIRVSDAIDAHGLHETFYLAAGVATIDDRVDADWLSCNGSDVVSKDSISQLQTTRRDYHAINIRGLVTATTAEHLRRSLFLAWDYGDPIAGVSLHLEPREDRRHAYQWHMPSGDPTRSICGGMIGANRLALEAWPLFQSLPESGRLTTVGFRGNRAHNTTFTWPLWSVPINLATLRSVLSLSRLHACDADDRDLVTCGIPVAYQCRRILVGKTPNLTSSIPILV